MPAMLEVIAVVLAHTIVAWVVTYLLHSTLLHGLARIAEGVREDGEWRTLIWRTALFAPLATASLHTFVPFGSPIRLSSEPAGAVLGPNPALAVAVVGAWILVIGMRMTTIVVSETRARAALGPRRRSRDARLHASLGAHARMAGLRCTPSLTTSHCTFSPAALTPAEVCIPARTFTELTDEQQDALLAHEVAHIARRDPLWCGAASAIARLCLFQPLHRAALTRLRRASEHAADSRALRAGADPLALAEALAALAPRMMRGPRLRTPATGAPLVERIERILGTPRTARALSPRTVLICTLLLAGTPLAAGPGINFSPENAANSIPWLAPSKQEPNVRMLEVRHFDRHLRDVLRRF